MVDKRADKAVVSSKIAPGAVQPQLTARLGPVLTIPAGGYEHSTVNCNIDEISVGGGYQAEGSKINVYKSYLSVDVRQWFGSAYNSDTVPHTFQLQVLCLKLNP